MLKKVLMSLGVCSLFYVEAAEISIKEAKATKDKKYVLPLRQYIRSKSGFVPESDKDVLQAEYENELLANAYVDKYDSEDFRNWLHVYINAVLAKKMVKEVQRSVKIDDDVLRSYYLSNLEKFRLAKRVKADVYVFKTLDDAFDVYQYAKSHDVNASLEYAEAKKLKKVSYDKSIHAVYPATRALLDKDMNRTNYFTPPYFGSKRFLVTYVHFVRDQDGYLPFEAVRKKIAAELYKKTYLKKRKELVQKYETRTNAENQ